MSEAPKMGAQATICAGGRYDHLVEEVGGPQTPGFGFAMGLERLLITMEAERSRYSSIERIRCLCCWSRRSNQFGSIEKSFQAIRNFGFSADRDFYESESKSAVQIGR